MAEHTTNPAVRQIHNGDVLYHSYVRNGCPVVRWWARFWCCFALVEKTTEIELMDVPDSSRKRPHSSNNICHRLLTFQGFALRI